MLFRSIDYKKQKAVECNVFFTHNSTDYIGYFASSIRTITENEFIGSQAILPDETPLLILPTGALTIGDTFIIDDTQKPWKIQEYDSITNRGISYLYLERGLAAKDETDVTDIVLEETVYLDETDTDSTILRPMTEYTFVTSGAYFVTSPRVEILGRTLEAITFRIPFGIPTVRIETKPLEVETIQQYTVVL